MTSGITVRPSAPSNRVDSRTDVRGSCSMAAHVAPSHGDGRDQRETRQVRQDDPDGRTEVDGRERGATAEGCERSGVGQSSGGGHEDASLDRSPQGDADPADHGHQAGGRDPDDDGPRELGEVRTRTTAGRGS
jgi:hypothetical protein